MSAIPLLEWLSFILLFNKKDLTIGLFFYQILIILSILLSINNNSSLLLSNWLAA